LPERIKLQSQSLWAILELNIPRGFISSESGHAMVFLRPYRVFVYHEKQLREFLSRLEQRYQDLRKNDTSLPISKSDSTEGNLEARTAKEDQEFTHAATGISQEFGEQGPMDNNLGAGKTGEKHEKNIDKLKNKSEALLHLRCLISFVDDNIKPTIDYLESDRCKDVFFHDLWHLFRPGTEVIDQLEKQAYRVVRVQAAKHKVDEKPWLRWSNTAVSPEDGEYNSPIKIHCAYIDFDGKQFGPVSTKFEIFPYGGIRPVTKLPVYPLRLAKNRQLRLNLIERGKMLLSVSKFKSMYYTGHTLDSRDEVDSQVVVDFAEALAGGEREHWTPRFNNLKLTTSETGRGCRAPCCYGLAVHNDDYVDAALAEDFVKTLIPADTTTKAPSLLLTPRSLSDSQSGFDNEPSDEELVVMTYRVFGFVLRSRKWGMSSFLQLYS
jgi:hypothetical protein